MPCATAKATGRSEIERMILKRGCPALPAMDGSQQRPQCQRGTVKHWLCIVRTCMRNQMISPRSRTTTMASCLPLCHAIWQSKRKVACLVASHAQANINSRETTRTSMSEKSCQAWALYCKNLHQQPNAIAYDLYRYKGLLPFTRPPHLAKQAQCAMSFRLTCTSQCYKEVKKAPRCGGIHISCNAT